MSQPETGITRSMIDERSSDYAAWYGRTTAIAEAMYPNDPVMADAADQAMFLHLSELSEEPGAETPTVPDWVASDQFEDWLASRAAAEVADGITLEAAYQRWRTTEAGRSYKAIARVDEPDDLDQRRATKLLTNANVVPPTGTARDVARDSIAIFSAALRDPALQRGFEDAGLDPEVFGAYVGHLSVACTREGIDRHNIHDDAFTTQMIDYLMPVYETEVAERIWGIA